MSRFRGARSITVIAVWATVIAFALWVIAVAAIWLPLSDRAYGDIRAAADFTATSAVMLWLFRWLGNKGMLYLIEMLLTQRDWTRRRLPSSGPHQAMRPVPPARHARRSA